MNLVDFLREQADLAISDGIPETGRGFSQCADEIENLREFIRYWSYCTRQGMLKYSPEKKNEWTEFMLQHCPTWELLPPA